MSKLIRQMVRRYFIYTSVSLSSLILALSISWVVLAKVDFLYPVWHDLGGIGAGIDKYGPLNRYKPGFGDTDKAQRSELFALINDAVHREGGLGLADIDYETASSAGTQQLLRRDEIVHLVDVANLIAVLKKVVLGNAICWLLLSVCVLRWCGWWRRVLSLKTQSLTLFCVLSIALLVLLAIGPVKVFNQFHIWVFPDEHPWFFYYQDSLMSTLMLAPTLFGWIAAALVVVALPIYMGLCLALRYVAIALTKA